jgi:DNA repair exonuclease SbcCD ATPase subunit
MSQLETILWFGLGFAMASLIALFLGRAAWRSGVRLGARRMQRKVPGTVSELQTERDGMRAENAMMARKLEVRLGEMKARLAEQAAEVSRHRNRLELIAADLAQREKMDATLRAEIARLKEQVATFEDVVSQRADSVQMTIERLQAKDREINQQADEIAALKSKIWKLQAKTLPIEERLVEASEESEKLAAEVRALDQAWPEKLAELGFNNAEAAQPAAETASPAEARAVQERKAIAESDAQMASVNGGGTLVADARAEPPPPRPAHLRFAGNVISLAQRIKALQKTITR